ncbi:aromatic ring-hydroxylating dioxygenase subunit alpha [Rhodoferax ferrireducens]|uniref:aromatic ring-hydroxylating dioxygenase subunit alpha n=1 Tax=Rhodoferax ferrireducens TaxID=192843 RepID=UPI000E0CF93E|nr:aromatic ring-hydroxylating dioxygenase subunit alpha [Rhodoferax ferrireducens]
MKSYADQPQEIRQLVEPDRVHRDVYLSPELFALEQQHLFANTWTFIAHASQLPQPGDYITLDIAGRSLLVIRQADASIRVLYNRCAHKGAKVAGEDCGNAGKFLRCPYHAWTYKLDGAPLAVPLKSGYEGTGLKQCESGRGMTALQHVEVYRDFVFVKLNDGGPDFKAYFGDALDAIDNMVDRSPTGQLQVEGGVLRNVIHCNWKMYLENINDTVHPVSTHESAVHAAQKVWTGQPEGSPKPMSMEQILPFGASYDFFDSMGGRVYANGHSLLGVNFSIHSGYEPPPDYVAAMVAAHGETRTREVLDHSPQNAVLFPSLAVKGSPLAIRVIRPLGVDRTLIEAWSFRAMGAPDLLFERALTYNRLVFSPMSVVAHDDAHLFETIQDGLRSPGNEWVSLHRGFDPAEIGQSTITTNGTNELLMRNQFRAWSHYMTLDMKEAS